MYVASIMSESKHSSEQEKISEQNIDIKGLQSYGESCITQIVQDNMLLGFEHIPASLNAFFPVCINNYFEKYDITNYTYYLESVDVSYSDEKTKMSIDIKCPIDIFDEGSKKHISGFIEDFDLQKDYALDVFGGQLKDSQLLLAPDNNFEIIIPKGTKVTDEDGNDVNKVSIKIVDTNYFHPIGNSLNSIVYEVYPKGISFSKPIEMSFFYSDYFNSTFNESLFTVVTPSVDVDKFPKSVNLTLIYGFDLLLPLFVNPDIILEPQVWNKVNDLVADFKPSIFLYPLNSLDNNTIANKVTVSLDKVDSKFNSYALIPSEVKREHYDDIYYLTDGVLRSEAENNNYTYKRVEGYIFEQQIEGTIPFYELYNPYTKKHFYSTYEQEKDMMINSYGYVSNGVIGYVYEQEHENTIPLARIIDVEGSTLYSSNTVEIEHSKELLKDAVTKLISNYYNNRQRVIEQFNEMFLEEKEDGDAFYFLLDQINFEGNNLNSIKLWEEKIDLDEFNGFYFDGTVGYVLSEQVTGTIPLYRYSRHEYKIYFPIEGVFDFTYADLQEGYAQDTEIYGGSLSLAPEIDEEIINNFNDLITGFSITVVETEKSWFESVMDFFDIGSHLGDLVEAITGSPLAGDVTEVVCDIGKGAYNPVSLVSVAYKTATEKYGSRVEQQDLADQIQQELENVINGKKGWDPDILDFSIPDEVYDRIDDVERYNDIIENHGDYWSLNEDSNTWSENGLQQELKDKQEFYNSLTSFNQGLTKHFDKVSYSYNDKTISVPSELAYLADKYGILDDVQGLKDDKRIDEQKEDAVNAAKNGGGSVSNSGCVAEKPSDRLSAIANEFPSNSVAHSFFSGMAAQARAVEAKNKGDEEGSCFVAGTKVRMFDGSLKNIEDVKVGDVLLGLDDSSNVVIRLDRPTMESRQACVINDKIITTDDHPFLNIDGTWRVCDRLRKSFDYPHYYMEIGDELVTENGTEFINSIKIIDRPDDEVVYNFALNGSHTYIVEGFVVHNEGGGSSGGCSEEGEGEGSGE